MKKEKSVWTDNADRNLFIYLKENNLLQKRHKTTFKTFERNGHLNEIVIKLAEVGTPLSALDIQSKLEEVNYFKKGVNRKTHQQVYDEAYKTGKENGEEIGYVKGYHAAKAECQYCGPNSKPVQKELNDVFWSRDNEIYEYALAKDTFNKGHDEVFKWLCAQVIIGFYLENPKKDIVTHDTATHLFNVGDYKNAKSALEVLATEPYCFLKQESRKQSCTGFVRGKKFKKKYRKALDKVGIIMDKEKEIMG